MTNTDYLIETSILSTVLFAHHQYNNEAYFSNYELNEEWFSIQFHKLIVKTINSNRAIGLPLTEDYIAEQLLKNNIMNRDLWLTIISANPFGKANFDTYLEQLKGAKKAQIGDI